MQPPAAPQKTFTGRTRQRKTLPSVRLWNRTAGALITLGGLGTIVAVLLVCIFLVAVVVPLFQPPVIEALRNLNLTEKAERPKQLGLNEYATMGWILADDGTIRVFRLDTGSEIHQLRPFGDRRPTAAAFAIRDGIVAFGFADGTVQYGTVDFSTRFLEPDTVPETVRGTEAGTAIPFENGMLERTPENQYRLQTLLIDLKEPVLLEEGAPIRLIDVSMKSSGPVIAAITASRTFHIDEVATRKNILTGKITLELSGGRMKLDYPDGDPEPSWLVITGLGDNAFIAWGSGRVIRLDTRNLAESFVVEEIDLVPEPEHTLSALTTLIGKTSLVSGDSAGRVRIWFRIKPEGGTDTADGAKTVLAHELPSAAGEVSALKASARTRILAAAYADGRARMFHVTSNRLLGEVTFRGTPGGGPVQLVTLSPKDDVLAALAGPDTALWSLRIPHPESSPAAIFRPVWYEGYDRPQHVWQSSSGTDDFEPKYGLLPLIFGTIKATFYSMLFGAPLALLAAVYASELMNVNLRGRVKTTIEMMASLPSVVLGFLAAIIVAPFVESVVPQALCVFATVPFSVLLGGYLWQLLPAQSLQRWDRLRWAGVTAAAAAGVALAFAVGPVVEKLLFAGDIKAWLSGRTGSGTGGWMFLLLPSTALLAVVLLTSRINPILSRRYAGWPTARVAAAELVKYLVAAAAVLAVSIGVSYLLAHGPFDLWRFDPRGSFIDTYVQRNSLIVGFIMGFAIIPIIFTISEDALSAVPDHLRSASLAAGATPWQTALRIVIPTAASGLFSAVMIGFGRAVGETMIVLMAAGNTPLMDWNIFNGFRTLSANIAVELPEAVKDSTHFRMLFLAALALFVMTFLLNTLAETVRQRFRKRAFEL